MSWPLPACPAGTPLPSPFLRAVITGRCVQRLHILYAGIASFDGKLDSFKSAGNRDSGGFCSQPPSSFHVAQSHSFVLQCFVVAAAQVGSHNDKRSSYGHAMCVDPWGKVLAEAGSCSIHCAATSLPLRAEVEFD
jgi:hypothetical protein